MAKVILTIEDNADGSINIQGEFDPPVKRNEEPTDAQMTAMLMLNAVADPDFDPEDVERVAW